jgi:hypothetical protein
VTATPGSTVKSAARSERMKARWADPAYAAAQKTKLAEQRAGILARKAAAKTAPVPGQMEIPAAPPTGGGAQAPAPFTDRRLFGRRRSS